MTLLKCIRFSNEVYFWICICTSYTYDSSAVVLLCWCLQYLASSLKWRLLHPTCAAEQQLEQLELVAASPSNWDHLDLSVSLLFWKRTAPPTWLFIHLTHISTTCNQFNTVMFHFKRNPKPEQLSLRLIWKILSQQSTISHSFKT